MLNAFIIIPILGALLISFLPVKLEDYQTKKIATLIALLILTLNIGLVFYN